MPGDVEALSMGEREPRRGDALIRWGYWIVLVLLAIGAARTLLRLARMWGWI